MSTSVAQIGFKSEISPNLQQQPETATIVDYTMAPIKRKKRVVKGRVKIKLGKSKVVSIAPSTLIGHISSTKLKAAARSVIRQQAAGQRRSSGNKKKKSAKRRKSKSSNRKVANYIV